MSNHIEPRFFVPSGSLTPEERLQELAGIFAKGLARLRAQANELLDPKNPQNSVPSGLELPDKSALTVHTG